jgi:GT2 family glycosyltransferase
MSSERVVQKKQTSYLDEGNKAFHEQKYPAAVALYLQALQCMPQLKKIVAFKIRLAWRRYQNLWSSKGPLVVALCGSDLAYSSDRLDIFSELYGSFAEAHTINEDFSKSTSSWITHGKSAFLGANFPAQSQNNFLKQAIQKVAENPFDIVHLLVPSATGIFFAMLYKLIWGATVLVDIDENQFYFSSGNPETFKDYLQKKQNMVLENAGLRRFALHLAHEIDGITVSSVKLQQLFKGQSVISTVADHGRFENALQLQQLLDAIAKSGKDINQQETFIDEYLTAFSILSARNTARSCKVWLEEATLKIVSGWAICPEKKNERIFLKVNLNDHPLHIANTYRFRGEVKKAYGGEGFVGFLAEMNEYLDFSGHAEISVEPISHLLAETDGRKNLAKSLPCLLKGRHFTNVNEKANILVQRNFHSINQELNTPVASFSVSIIILNFNGLNVLRRCLRSIYANTDCKFEVIVIDHGSTDGSVEFLKSSKYPTLRSFFRGKNFSFSASNNFAVQQVQGDILVFMNNDMIIVDDAISAMAATAFHSDFGLVGIKLWDMPQGLPVELSKSLNVVQHLGVHFRDCHRENIVEAYETRLPAFWGEESDVFETPAVTAAMMAISKSDFLLAGGFDEDYFYGQEDVDFCLKYMRSSRKKTGVLLRHGAYHARGLTRYNSTTAMNAILQNNRSVLQQKTGQWLRKKLREDQISRSGYWCPKPYSIAMIVSDIGFETDKADYFTARELGDAIEQETNAVVGYFSSNENESKIDVSGYDAVIVFLDRFDPGRLINVGSSTYLIAWARNWFDRWCERAWIHMYDLLFASSEYSLHYMEEVLQRKVHLLRIAASSRCIKGGEKASGLHSDYCFTGSYFDSPREIAEFLNPTEIGYDFSLFGHNWEKHPKFSDYTKGPVSYEDIPSIYASTRLVVDDANIATKRWGAVNSRMFDALASGTMCITNNMTGCKEVFGDEFPHIFQYIFFAFTYPRTARR